MKGFSGFGNSPAKDMKTGKYKHSFESPAKISDDDLVKMEGQLAKTELEFKEPRWAGVARKAHEGAKKVARTILGAVSGGDGKAGEGTGGDASAQTKKVVDSVSDLGKDVKIGDN